MHPVQSGVKRKLGVPFGNQSYLAGEGVFFVNFLPCNISSAKIYLTGILLGQSWN